MCNFAEDVSLQTFMQTIPVFFTFDKYYVVAAEVAIYSLLKHASPQYRYKLYVLHSNIPESSQKKLRKITGKFPEATIDFINTDSFEEKYPDLPAKKHFSKDVFYKLTAAEMFPEYDRIICSDVDVVFTGDFSPSYFAHPEDDFYFACVEKPLKSNRMTSYKRELFTPEEYDILQHEIMAGYLLINLKYIREKGIQKTMTDYYIRNFDHLPLGEQDAITLCCYPDLKHLPLKYVVCNDFYLESPENLKDNPDSEEFAGDRPAAMKRFKEALEHPVQIHYVGPRKPWHCFGVPKQDVWFAYLKESGTVTDYLLDYPRQQVKKLDRLSLKRFLTKTYRKIKS